MAYVTPSVILWAAVALVIGAVSMAFNPLFVPSAVAVGAGVLSVRAARRLEHPVARGVLLSLAVVGIMAGLGGVAIAVRLISGMA